MTFVKGHKINMGNEYCVGRTPWNKGLKGYLKGKVVDEETRNKISIAHIGMKHTLEAREKISKSQIGKTGVNSCAWRGGLVGYGALHTWVRKNLGKPKECVYCGSEQIIQWANISHEYKRDLSDWIPLCIKCHGKYDTGEYHKRVSSFFLRDKGESYKARRISSL